MNKVILMGRLTRDPEVRYSPGQNGSQFAVSRFSIAVDRRFAGKAQDGSEVNTDFFNCTALGKQGEFVDKYLRKGTKVVVVGRIENDNYTNKSGEKVYSVRIVVEEVEFAESKKAAEQNGGNVPGYNANNTPDNNFLDIPEGIENDLPFK